MVQQIRLSVLLYDNPENNPDLTGEQKKITFFTAGISPWKFNEKWALLENANSDQNLFY